MCKKKLTATVLIIALVVSMLSACGSPSPSATTPPAESQPAAEAPADAPSTEPAEGPPSGEVITLRVGVMPYLCNLTTKYMLDQGWVEAAGLKFETISFPSGAAMNESLAADLLDVGIMSGAAVTAVAAYDCYILGETADSAGGIGLFVREDSPILTVKGANPQFPDVYGDAETVKGKQLLVPIGTMSHNNALTWLDAIGLTVDDVEVVHMEFASAYQAFLAGQGDIVALNPPLSYKAGEHGWVDAASMVALDMPLCDSLVCNPKSYEDPDLRYAIEKYLEFIFDANEILRADTPLAEERLLAWYKENGSDVSPEDVASELQTRFLLTREEARTKITVGASAKTMATFMVEVGTLEADKLPKFDSNVKTEIWDKVLAE